MKFVCKVCGTEKEFENEKRLWLAGWDCFTMSKSKFSIEKKTICTCDKCPSAPSLLEEIKEESG